VTILHLSRLFKCYFPLVLNAIMIDWSWYFVKGLYNTNTLTML